MLLLLLLLSFGSLFARANLRTPGVSVAAKGLVFLFEGDACITFRIGLIIINESKIDNRTSSNTTKYIVLFLFFLLDPISDDNDDDDDDAIIMFASSTSSSLFGDAVVPILFRIIVACKFAAMRLLVVNDYLF